MRNDVNLVAGNICMCYDTDMSTVLQGGLTRYSSLWNGGGCQGQNLTSKNHFDFKDMLTFGIFLLALLTFVFTFCK